MLCWIDRVWSFKDCVHLYVPSIKFVCACVCRKFSSDLGV